MFLVDRIEDDFETSGGRWDLILSLCNWRKTVKGGRR